MNGSGSAKDELFVPIKEALNIARYHARPAARPFLIFYFSDAEPDVAG